MQVMFSASVTVAVTAAGTGILKHFCDMCLNWYNHSIIICWFNRLEAIITKTLKQSMTLNQLSVITIIACKDTYNSN